MRQHGSDLWNSHHMSVEVSLLNAVTVAVTSSKISADHHPCACGTAADLELNPNAETAASVQDDLSRFTCLFDCGLRLPGEREVQMVLRSGHMATKSGCHYCYTCASVKFAEDALRSASDRALLWGHNASCTAYEPSETSAMAAFPQIGSLPTAPCRWRPSQRPQCTASRSQSLQCRAAASSESSSRAASTSGRSPASSQRGTAGLAQQAAFAAAGLAGAVVGASAVSALFAPGPAGAATQAIGALKAPRSQRYVTAASQREPEGGLTPLAAWVSYWPCFSTDPGAFAWSTAVDGRVCWLCTLAAATLVGTQQWTTVHLSAVAAMPCHAMQ